MAGVAEFLPSSPSKAWPPRQKALLLPRPYSFPRWRWTLGCDRGAVCPRAPAADTVCGVSPGHVFFDCPVAYSCYSCPLRGAPAGLAAVGVGDGFEAHGDHREEHHAEGRQGLRSSGREDDGTWGWGQGSLSLVSWDREEGFVPEGLKRREGLVVVL